MRDTPHAPNGAFDPAQVGSLRRRILEYIAQQGGELRADSAYGLRRQISEALGEGPGRVSQTLIGLEKSGQLQREMDLERHRCQAIRLFSGRPEPHPSAHRTGRATPPGTLPSIDSWPGRQQAELQVAEQELTDLIRQAANASRRVARLRAVLRAQDHEQVPSR
jgi:hypothetical protein